MFSAVACVRQGVAKQLPERLPLTAEEQEALLKQAESMNQTETSKKNRWLSDLFHALFVSRISVCYRKKKKTSEEAEPIEDELKIYNLDNYDDEDTSNGLSFFNQSTR